MLPKILHLLIDHNNLGILYVSQDVTVVNFLKEGFLEGTVRTIFPSYLDSSQANPQTYIENQELSTRHVSWTNNGNKLVNLPEEYITDDFLKNKKLAAIRAPFMTKLVSRVNGLLKDKSLTMPFPHSFDSALQTAIDASNPQMQVWHRDILEMARILGWTPEMVYKDTKLKLESSNSFKVKVYALTNKFSSLINKCTTTEEIASLENEYDIITTKNQRI